MFILFTIILVAISLSMDTFSLSLSYGMLNIKRKDIIRISLFVGLFHFLMPLLGNLLGNFMFSIIPIDEKKLIGIIFLAISIEIIVSLYKEKNTTSINSFFDVLLFSFTVSIDSFVTGTCLDVFEINYFIIVIIFMIISSIFTFIGLLLGFSIHKKIGFIAEIIGVILLLSLSIFYLIY